MKVFRRNLLLLASTVAFILISLFVISTRRINQSDEICRSTHTKYCPPSVPSYEDCLSEKGHTFKGDPNDPKICITSNGWEYPKPYPTKTIPKVNEYSLKDNQFISSYNLTDSLSFTLDIPPICELVNKEYSVNKYLSCTFSNNIIEIKPTEGGRSGDDTNLDFSVNNKYNYGGYEWDSTLHIFKDGHAFSIYQLTHPVTNDYFLMNVYYYKYSAEAEKFVNTVFQTMKFDGKVIAQ
ncbi:hypothetical protein IPM62_02305 [Candidatus Woesebacteria bacterium]|nr:MAG: hypothetical protein IPM62_02305 [Candidatus Woesebacteria bacterium]